MKLSVTAVASALLFASTSVVASFDAFLVIAGIPGESQDEQYQDSSEILSFEQNVEVTKKSDSCPNAVIVSKKVDNASLPLISRLLSETPVDATLYFRRAGGTEKGGGLTFLEISMIGAQVMSVKNNGSDGDDLIEETIILCPNEVLMNYTPQRGDGSSGTPIDVSWDIGANGKK